MDKKIKINAIWSCFMLLFLTSGILSALASYYFGEHIDYLSFVSLIGLLNKMLIICGLFSVLLLFWGRTRAVSICMILFIASFYLTSGAIHKRIWSYYVKTSEGRLGYDIETKNNLSDWLMEITKSLAVNDSRSRIYITDNRPNTGTDRAFFFSWRKYENMEDVLHRLDSSTVFSIEWAIEGNPWCNGPVHGNIYRILINDTNAVTAPFKKSVDAFDGIE